MKVRTDVKSGGLQINRCDTIAKKTRAPRVRTGVKAGSGAWAMNLCESLVRARG